MMLSNPQLVAMLTAAASGWAVIRIARKMTFEGVGFEDGGGYTALLIAALMINLASVAVALA